MEQLSDRFGINCLFGKTLTNPSNFNINVYLCTDKDEFIKRLCNSNFVNVQILTETKVLMTNKKK